MIFKVEDNKEFMCESIFCPVVVVLRKDFTYCCPRASLCFFGNKFKLKCACMCISSAGGRKPSVSRGSMSLCYQILELGKIIFKLDLYFLVKYCEGKLWRCIHFCNAQEREGAVLGFSAVLIFREVYVLLAASRCWSVGR